MKSLFPALILALAISYQPLPAVSAQAEQDTPEAVAKAYVTATQTADWAKAASFMHPDSLAQLKKVFEPIFTHEKASEIAGPIFGVKSRAEFDQASGAQMFEKLMSGVVAAVPGFNKVMDQVSFDIIGRVAETPELVHLVYRTQVPLDDMQPKGAPNITKNVTFSKMEVMTLKRYENTWRLTLSGEIEGMAQMFANFFAAAAAAPAEEVKGAAPAEEVKGAPRKTTSTPAKARKPARKP